MKGLPDVMLTKTYLSSSKKTIKTSYIFFFRKKLLASSEPDPVSHKACLPLFIVSLLLSDALHHKSINRISCTKVKVTILKNY